MGFAYVLKQTGCDQDLVRWLMEPVRYVRFLLIPGVVLVGFLVNIPVVSQTSTAVCLGTVVVPIMRAAGFSAIAIGSTMLLGCSVGGELLNPAAPELITVKDKTGIDTRILTTQYLPQLVFPVLAISTIVFWIQTWWLEKKNELAAGLPAESKPVRQASLPLTTIPGAMVPLVPLAILMFTGPPFEVFHVPHHWLAEPGKSADSRLIGLAMIVGVLVAALVKPRHSGNCVKVFFEGAGYGYTHVISLIIVANCFGEAIKQVGLANELGKLIQAQPVLLTPLSAIVPWLFAMICGSGMASTQSLYGFFYQPAMELNVEPNSVGAMVSMGSAIGRTMSPFAAVTLMCVTLTGTSAIALIKRIAIPLMTGLLGVVFMRMFGLV
jgi:DcuC family C4-dicarboxylate transporter